VLFISIREFSKIIISRPRLGMKVISSLSMLLHTLVGKISELTLSDAQSRLAKYLLEGVKTTASGPAIELSITKSALATELNIKLETLSRLFARLKKKRLISVNKGRIVLIDPDRVRMVAVGELKI
jgi:CRP-like cAMP-binding protein